MSFLTRVKDKSAAVALKDLSSSMQYLWKPLKGLPQHAHMGKRPSGRFKVAAWTSERKC